ncbi:hypothetical protein [Bremerella sp.]|uniref:hypothetical protein n=1 Tax=Bremerella sp. TaxID=2795602 RepID=UPI00391AF66E
MSRFPYSSPELGYIVLVMALPLAVGFLWRPDSIWGFLGIVGIGMALGFAVWLGMLFLICWCYERMAKDEKTQT